MLAQRLLFGSGILVALLPFLGFPSNWDTVFYVLLGLFVSFISFSIKDMHQKIKLPNSPNLESSFTENNPMYESVPTAKRKRVRRIHPIKEGESRLLDSADI
jgi:hypothetical protein